MKFAKGFTLIELMIVVAILAIITSVGLPMYNNYVTRGKITEATSNLSAMRVQMEQYFQDNRSYQNAGVCGAALPPAKYFAYTCAGTPTTYTVTATGQAGMAGFAYTIDQLNNKQTTGTPAGWGAGAAAPAGAIPPNPAMNCWVLNKGGQC